MSDGLEEFEDELTAAKAGVAEAEAASSPTCRSWRASATSRRHAATGPGRLRELPQAGAARADHLVERATQRLVEDLLPVLDSFDGALGSLAGADSPEAEKVRDGVMGIRSQFVAALEKAGLERIEADGAPFDPNEHEAVLQDAGAGEPHVAETMRTGYRLKGRVLRPAMVRVSHGG